jgi:hypothetical protein
MTFFFRLAIVAAFSASLTGPGIAAGPMDLKEFIKEAFQDQIDNIKSGIYCRAFSCNFEVESFFVTETDPKSYVLSASGWLEGTIPGLRGSARRSVGLTGSYTRGTCIVKDLKPLYDNVTNNNGWGATKIEAAFKHVQVPPTVVLAPEVCAKVDAAVSEPPQSGQPSESSLPSESGQPFESGQPAGNSGQPSASGQPPHRGLEQ